MMVALRCPRCIRWREGGFKVWSAPELETDLFLTRRINPPFENNQINIIF
jgi:hypothetical protein